MNRTVLFVRVFGVLSLLGGCGSSSGGSGAQGAETATEGGSTAGSASGASATGGNGSAGRGGRNAAEGGAPPAETGDVLERNNHPTRDGHYVQPLLTKAAVAQMAPDAEFDASTESASQANSSMFGTPLFMANGPGAKPAYFAATTANDVFAFDATTGARLWLTNIGSSPTRNAPSGGCGDIHPLGILSTPVIDAAKRTLYAVGAIGTTSISRFELHALSIDDGSERTGFPIDLTQIPADKMVNVYNHNQRGALALVNGVVYVPFGGHNGDCGTYNGRVIAVDTANPAQVGAWQTRHQGEGIWAPGGLASDGNGVLAITGNYTPFGAHAASRSATDSEEVVRLTGLAALTRNNENLYYATDWQALDDADADFGAINPVVLTVPNSTPSALVAAMSKDGRIHLLDAANLGGSDGKTPLRDFRVAQGDMSVHTVPAAYKTATSSYIAFTTDRGALCPSGGPSGRVLMSVAVTPGAPPSLKVAWCAALGGTMTTPAVTTTDGSANAVVWYVNDEKLTALDGDTGKVLFTSTNECPVEKWTAVIAANGHIVAGSPKRLCSWSPQ